MRHRSFAAFPVSSSTPPQVAHMARASDPTPISADPDALPPAVVRAFAPLHKTALGVAVGTAAALAVLALTVSSLLRGMGEHSSHLGLLSEYFYGYSVTWLGAPVGAFWAFVVGFVAGWFTAFCRNLVIAAALVLTRTRAELAANRDFLDHI
jgi:hypothetical protein